MATAALEDRVMIIAELRGWNEAALRSRAELPDRARQMSRGEPVIATEHLG